MVDWAPQPCIAHTTEIWQKDWKHDGPWKMYHRLQICYHFRYLFYTNFKGVSEWLSIFSLSVQSSNIMMKYSECIIDAFGPKVQIWENLLRFFLVNHGQTRAKQRPNNGGPWYSLFAKYSSSSGPKLRQTSELTNSHHQEKTQDPLLSIEILVVWWRDPKISFLYEILPTYVGGLLSAKSKL